MIGCREMRLGFGAGGLAKVLVAGVEDMVLMPGSEEEP